MSRNRWRSAGVVADRALPRPPCAEPEADGVTGAAGYTTTGRGVLRVLVVDDNRDAADSLAMLVSIWGHDARRAYDGATALESAAADPPDVVLLDIGMPAMDGFHLAELLRRQTRLADTLLVAVTGYADVAHRRLWEGAADHYLVKPVDPATVERLLSARRDRTAGALDAPGGVPRGCGILAVDDDDGVRRLLDVGLHQEGLTPWLAADGRAALELYRRHRREIAAVLMDVRMPDLDGPQTLAALREIDPRVRCCFMSGDPGGYTEEGLRALGKAGFVRKPFRLPDVARALREAAAGPES